MRAQAIHASILFQLDLSWTCIHCKLNCYNLNLLFIYLQYSLDESTVKEQNEQ